jgi:hypothetical protein
MLTDSKIGKQIAFNHDLTSKITVCLSMPRQMQEPSSSLRPNSKSVL